MISIAIGKIEKVLSEFSKEIEKQRIKSLKNLKEIDTSTFQYKEIEFLNEVIGLFSKEKFTFSSPREIDTLVLALGPIPAEFHLLKERIITALNYKGLRKSFYPKYFGKIGVKSCVYCNSQLTVTVKKKDNVFKARFDVDHYYPKDSYPYLSISLFNLYPACSSCNRSKGVGNVEFKLYAYEAENSGKSFEFKLSPNAVARYLTNRDCGVIGFEFIEKPLPTTAYKSFQDMFGLTEIYQTQLDLAEELIIKSQIYNSRYKKLLSQQFSKLGLQEKLFERVILGNYLNAKDIHKRPMAKFTQDIAKQLNLI